jgi:hypothetical protein
MKNEIEESEGEDLDNQWIVDFEKTDIDYKLYYKEDLNYLKINIIYINKNGEIEKIAEDKYFFKVKNILPKEEIIYLIQKYRNSKNTRKKYSLLSIIKYNIDLEPLDIKYYIQHPYNFLQSLNSIDSITFEKTISMFQDLNQLFIFFYEKELRREKHNQTKKIILSEERKHKITIRK